MDEPATQAPPRTPDEDERDLGFGAVVSRESRMRLLNRDGTFNVQRRGLSWFGSLSAFHWLLAMSWSRFFVVVATFYLASNAAFAGLYAACGPLAIIAPAGEGPISLYARAFFFSVQTLATIGYGHIHPVGMTANVLVTIESLFGLMGFALVTGILFARFSRPTARILFSERAVVAPHAGGAALMFRIVNGRRTELIEVDVRVVMSRFETFNGSRRRQYHRIHLERSDVVFFPLGLTLVHPIDEKSPLFGVSPSELDDSEAEFLVLIRAIDEGMSQTVHARTSYRAHEITWGAKFVSLFDQPDDGRLVAIDVEKLHRVESAPLPSFAASPPSATRAT
jgi:inward rectifier potassium channel